MDEQNQKSQKDILEKAKQLPALIQQASDDFSEKTDALIEEINKGLDEAEAELDKADTYLTEFEKQAVDEIDAVVLKFLSEEG